MRSPRSIRTAPKPQLCGSAISPARRPGTTCAGQRPSRQRDLSRSPCARQKKVSGARCLTALRSLRTGPPQLTRFEPFFLRLRQQLVPLLLAQVLATRFPPAHLFGPVVFRVPVRHSVQMTNVKNRLFAAFVVLGPWGAMEQWMQLRFIVGGIGHRAATIWASSTATLFVLFAAATGTGVVSTRFGCLQPDCLPA
jgi:hypothetical protein